MNLNEPNDLKYQKILKNEYESTFDVPDLPNILVIGVGGAGNNCIHQLNTKGVPGAKTVAINTDKQQLDLIDANYKILIGKELAHGMGVGGDPVLGSKCAKASETDIEGLFENVELVFLIAGMGGGTGTGAAPVIADLARGLNSTVIGVVTIPFYFEFGRKLRAKRGIRQMAASTHSLLVIDNNRLLGLVPDLPLDRAFNQINDLITEVVSGITETMTKPSLINLDFADIKTIMRNGNQTLLCYGESDTLDPDEIVRNTLNNPLLNLNFNGANNALIHITGGPDLSLELTDKITKRITKKLNPKANVILGARINPEFKNEIKLLTIMTGMNEQYSNNHYYDLNTTGKNLI